MGCADRTTDIKRIRPHGCQTAVAGRGPDTSGDDTMPAGNRRYGMPGPGPVAIGRWRVPATSRRIVTREIVGHARAAAQVLVRCRTAERAELEDVSIAGLHRRPAQPTLDEEQRAVRRTRPYPCPRSNSKKNAPKGVRTVALVDLRGIEPLTSSMPRKRAPAAPQARNPTILPEHHPPSNGNPNVKRRNQPTCTTTPTNFGRLPRTAPDGKV
jgi:hypothetical protein